MVVTAPLVIPDLSFDIIRERVAEYWDPVEAPHMSIMGQTRSGKSFLARHGIVSPMLNFRKLLILDAKGTDATLRGFGRPVQAIPRYMRTVRQMIREERPGDNWFRLQIRRGQQAGHDQVGEALEIVYNEGDWIVLVDELRHLVDARYPGINLKDQWEELMLRGGSRGIGLINLSQEPKWLPSSYYTQASFYWISRIEDEAVQKRITEIGSSRALLPHLQTIPKRQWLYMDNLDDDRFWARTMVVK